MQITAVDRGADRPGQPSLQTIAELDPTNLRLLLEQTGQALRTGVSLRRVAPTGLCRVTPTGTPRSDLDGGADGRHRAEAGSGATVSAQAAPVACCRVLPV
ncbi:hypothetical protein ACFP2T_17220 [Plantactinospora solaniradicis]|uniref:Uncharacterized protein n=1 Tax=Plantactinospora solaniradicis TaxID=1723736 RepID=A0ABW1K907_9ACTN